MDVNIDTNKEAASTSTHPGAVHADASSMKGKQAFQKTTVTGGPMYYPEDDEEQQLAARHLEQESVSSERAAAKSRNEKAEAKSKHEGKAKKHSIADEELKSRSQRQENRRERISSRTTSGEDTHPPTRSESPSQESEQGNGDKDEENPGAVRVAGMNSMDSPGVKEGDLAMEREDSTNTIDEMNTAIPTGAGIILEAKLVADEEDTDRVTQQERENIEEEARQRLLGDAAQAEVVEDDGSKPRRSALLCVAIVVILSAIILVSVLGTRDTSSSSITIPNNSTFDTIDSCENAVGPITKAEFARGSTSIGATLEVPSCGAASNVTTPAVWYTVIGDGGNITLSTCNKETDFDSQISVFTGSCDQLTCVDGNANACGSQSRLEFQSIRNQTYHVLVHGFGDSSGKFDLQIVFTRLSDLFFKDYKVSVQALQDQSSPQYLALDWMIDSDNTTLQSTLSDDELVERFALVLLYFATGGGESWLDQQAGFNTCSSNSNGDGTRVLGVGCNDEGSIVTLDLCKFPKSSTS
jgi:hypothetical protein